MKNILSVDLESWVHFRAFVLKDKSLQTTRARKTQDNNYLRSAIDHLLNLLDKYHQTATFFVVAEVYDWYPESIQEIQKRGHELGFHSYDHPLIYSRKILDEQFQKSNSFLNRFHPIGFRAPRIFITVDALASLKEHGFIYSSSTYDDGRVRAIKGIDEIPVSAMPRKWAYDRRAELPQALNFRLLFRKLPFGSGLFVAIFGSKISYFIDSFNRRGLPAVLLVHPWQLYGHKKLRGVGFWLELLRCNPFYLPYTRNICSDFEKLLARYQFASFQECFYGY